MEVVKGIHLSMDKVDALYPKKLFQIYLSRELAACRDAFCSNLHIQKKLVNENFKNLVDLNKKNRVLDLKKNLSSFLR